MIFDKIIGQEKVKKRLSFYLESQRKTFVSPHLLFVAPRGSGKTTLATLYAKQLVNTDGANRRGYLVNCSSLKSIKSFFDDVVDTYIVGKESTIIFDEASEIPKPVETVLLTILNPNKENKNTFLYNDATIEFDFRKTTFLFATTEAHKIHHALMDRMERIDLEEYSNDELAAIVQKNTDVPITPRALEEIKKVLRGNARKATQMANNITLYIDSVDKEEFSMEDWQEFKLRLGINPLGLTPMEIKILKILSEKSLTTLTNLSAKTQMSRQSLQRDAETYLQKLNLMEITVSGRKITSLGRNYLESLK